jgi:hypothetical protein
MKMNSSPGTGGRSCSRHWRWLLPAALAAIVIGCATADKDTKAPTPRDDFREYRQLVIQAMADVDRTLHALDEISIQAIKNPRPAYEAFAKSVHRLEVDSIRLRARAQAMRARGGAYFEFWEKYLAGVDNEQVRDLAAKHREELRQCFEQAQKGSQQVREEFRPFLSDLQKLRAMLESDPSLARIDSAKPVILSAKDRSRRVEQGLDLVLLEMNSMVALLRPAAPVAKP